MEHPDFGWDYPPGVTRRDIERYAEWDWESEEWPDGEDPGEPWMEEDL